MSDFLELSVGVAIIFIGALALLGIIIVPAFWLSSASCHSQARAMELESSWGPLQDCMVKLDGQFVPLSSYLSIRGVHGK